MSDKLMICVCCFVCVCVYLTDGKDLYIGKAVQKAYLEVTEEGAEGAVGSGRFIIHITACITFSLYK